MSTRTGMFLAGLTALLLVAQSHAQSVDPLAGNLTVVDGAGSRVRLGGSLRLKADGELAKSITKELIGHTGALTLYLSGIRMEKLPVRPLNGTPNTADFAFDLVRNAQDDLNRKAWDALLEKQDSYDMNVDVALGVGKNPQRLVDAAHNVTLYVAEDEWIYTVVIGAIVILLGAFIFLILGTRMLRDEQTGLYSLGKSQMAFWGLLVALTFIGVWILTGTMERIPAQALMLLGISAGTGLSAILIGRDDQAKRAAARLKRSELGVEAQTLRVKQTTGALDAAETVRLASVQTEIDAIDEGLQAGQPQNFFKDIINDGRGSSFHRLQVVIWTVVLGLVFGRTVMQTISMPEFPETLLILMGISNGTYLGFKAAEG
jgi:hypothetical protein